MKKITITVTEDIYNQLLSAARREKNPLSQILLKKMRLIPQRHPHLANLSVRQLLRKTQPQPESRRQNASEKLRDFLY